MMTSLDLFAGAGGMTLGFKNAGIKSIGAIELDRFAAETFSRNFPEFLCSIGTYIASLMRKS